MAHTVVKILTSDDGTPRDKHLQVWHLSMQYGDSPRTVCGGEAYGFGESGCQYEEKIVESGGITCLQCKVIVKKFKQIKL